MIVGVTGYLASGKDTVADFLIKKGYNHYSLSDEIRSELKDRNIESTRENQQRVANELRKNFGPEYLAKKVMKKAKEPAVVTSIRNIGEVEYLKNNGMKLIFVDAPIKIRYDRSINRKREGEEILSFEQFKAQEDFEKSKEINSQQLQLVAELADYTILNEGTLKELHEKIDKIMKEMNA
jgi:dephospho-CoA kinase